MTLLGVALFAASALWLVLLFARSERRSSFPAYGAAGLLVIGGAAVMRWLEVGWVGVFFTPIVWTGYILAIDAAVFRIRGRSMLKTYPSAFWWMAVVSIPLWLVFEAYNLRLKNWTYVGLPENVVVRCSGYLWSFATIWPAILETAEFLLATKFRGDPAAKEGASWTPAAPVIGGAVMVTVPVMVPAELGAYLFGLVWIGFALLLDPLNYRSGRGSIWGDLAAGRRRRLWSLLMAGLVCGFFWEFWNYWAAGRWLYVFPILQSGKIFEMPAPGYLGFPVFAVEVFAIYIFIVGIMHLPYYELR